MMMYWYVGKTYNEYTCSSFHEVWELTERQNPYIMLVVITLVKMKSDKEIKKIWTLVPVE